MSQDNKNFGQNKPANVPGKNVPGQNPTQYQTPAKPQGYAEQKGGVTWTGKDIETLKQLAQQNTPVETICSELGKTEDVIKAKARELKITLAAF